METQRIRYIYEIRNKLNGKTYIGQHTLRFGRSLMNDRYYGSGVYIRRAQKKYGLKNFEKIIIISGYFSKEQINRFEKCMIACQRICGKAEYNISDGGESWGCGGHYYWEHATEEQKAWHRNHNKNVAVKASIEAQKNITFEMRSERAKKGVETMRTNGTLGQSFKGKQHSSESKQKMSEKAHLRTGDQNSSFGKHWFTNGTDNIKCETCPEGYYPGRYCPEITKPETLEKRKIQENKKATKEQLIGRILNCGVDLKANNVYKLLAETLRLDRTFIKNFVKNNMKEYKHMFYSRIEHMSK